MHLQAEIFNESIRVVAAMLHEWKVDADKWKEKIKEAEQNNKPTASMETYHYKQLGKIKTIEQFAENADNYITALEEEIRTLRSNQANNLISGAGSERIRICDLPAGPVNDHLETLELLNEILFVVSTKKNIY